MTFSSAYYVFFLFVFVSFLIIVIPGHWRYSIPDSDEDVSQVSSMSAVLLALPNNPL